ncbi:histidine kinase [Streptomyces sp. MST-110588]|uniref:sensor histidine kinase n=1 Tax=Streptomyces sp. MST-110588 TaxID=2833628 RepID=UPI001F5E10A0|nr:histidine kinase [Streptomyces sp. MST-110588]UNO41591.1 sensor histidine kinase [Streptomyces sp. MST-110588]
MSATGAIDGTGARGAPGGGPWWWERRRSAVLDVCLALASTAECLSEGADFAGKAGLPTALGLVLGLLVGPVLLMRRRWPIAVVLVAIAVTPAQMGVLLSGIGLYSLAASDVPRRIIGLLSGMSVVGTLIIAFVTLRQHVGAEPDFNPPQWFVPVMAVAVGLVATAPPVLWGLYIGARRRLVESLRERADGLERELSLLADRAEERAEWARNEERTRIAREMHDVVAHRVSLMVVHAAALQAVALKDPHKASKNAALVGDMGRQALTELREMLGVLRTAEGGSARTAPPSDEPERLAAVAARVKAAPAGASAASSASGRAPAQGVRTAARSGEPGAGAGPVSGPGAVAVVAVGVDQDAEGPYLAELGELVGQSRAAGMAVELLVEGEARACPPGVEQTAYRVVQEALTNVHKHAPGAWARVRLAHRPGEVAVQVENGPSARGAADVGLPSGGNGLVGMRERVTGLGGVFVSGPTEAGGFRVSAVLPGRTEAESGELQPGELERTAPERTAAERTAAAPVDADSARTDSAPMGSNHTDSVRTGQDGNESVDGLIPSPGPASSPGPADSARSAGPVSRVSR